MITFDTIYRYSTSLPTLPWPAPVGYFRNSRHRLEPHTSEHCFIAHMSYLYHLPDSFSFSRIDPFVFFSPWHVIGLEHRSSSLSGMQTGLWHGLSGMVMTSGTSHGFVTDDATSWHEAFCFELVMTSGTSHRFVTDDVTSWHGSFCFELVMTSGTSHRFVTDDVTSWHGTFCFDFDAVTFVIDDLEFSKMEKTFSYWVLRFSDKVCNYFNFWVFQRLESRI